MQVVKPAIINVPPVKDVDTPRFKLNHIQKIQLVYAGTCDHNHFWNIVFQIELGMDFNGCF